MDLPPPPPVNYYRHAYPPPDFHRFHSPPPSPLHQVHPPLPSSHLSGPSQFHNFDPPRLHHEKPRNHLREYPTHDHRNGDFTPLWEDNHFHDSRVDLQPPDDWLDQRNQRRVPFSSFHPQNERFTYGLIDEGLRGDTNREFPSRGSKDNFFYSRRDVHDSKHPYPSGGDRYPSNFRSHDAYLSSNLSSDSQSNLGNRLVYDDGDNKLRPMRQAARSEVLPGDRRSYDNHGARYDRKKTGEKFNGSPNKMMAQRKSVLFRLQSGKVESKNSNKSNEKDGFVRAQDDELMPAVPASHEGKGKKAFVRSQRQMEEKREEGTMELHVSIKSNALVAKPIMATPSPVAMSSNNQTKMLVAKPIMATPSPLVATSKSSLAMNIEFDKTNKADFPCVKSSEEKPKTGNLGDLSSPVDVGSRKLKEDVISDGSLNGSLKILFGRDKVGEANVENTSAAETPDCDGKVASYGGFLSSSLEVSNPNENSTSKQTPGLMISDYRGTTSVVSGGSKTESDMKKRKRLRKSKRLSKREAFSVHLTVKDEKDEKLTNVSQGGVSDLKEVDIEVEPIHTVLSITTPLNSSFECVDMCERSDLADQSTNDVCSASYSKNGLVELQVKSVVCEIGSLNDMQDLHLDHVLLSSDGHTKKVANSTIPFCESGKKAGNGLIGDCTSKNEKSSASVSKECDPSCLDTGLSRKSRKTLVQDVPVRNAGVEDGFCEDNLIQNNFFPNLHSVNTNRVTSEQDWIIKLLDTEASGGCLTYDLGVIRSLEIPSSNDVRKLPNNASTVITRDSALERHPTSMVSGLDDFGNQGPKVDLLNVKRKIDVRDDEGSYHAENVLELGGTHNNDGSSTSVDESFACTKMLHPVNAGNILENGSPEHSPSRIILTDGRKKKKVSPSRLSSPVLGEFDMFSCAKTTEFPFNSEKPGFSFTLEEYDTSLDCEIDLPCLKDPSSVVYTTCLAPPSGNSCGSTMVCRTDTEDEMKTFSTELVAGGGPEESHLVSSTADGQNPMNTTTASDDSRNIFVTPDMDQKLQNIDFKSEEQLLKKKFLSSSPRAILHSDVNRYAFQNALESTSSPELVATTFHNNDLGINNMSNMNGTATEETKIVHGNQAAINFETPSISAKSGSKLEDGMVMDLPHNPKNLPSLDGNITKASGNLNPLLNTSMNNKWLSTSISSCFPDNGSVRFSSGRKRGAISHVAKPRTWHRNGPTAQSVARPKNLGNLVSSLASAPQVNVKVPNSYIRKGNSLLRKPSPVVSETSKDTRSKKLNVIGPLTLETKGGPSAAQESLETPPIGGSVATFDPSVACTKQSMVPLFQTNSSTNSDGLIKVVEGNDVKKITYLKRKSNQLVAASSSGNACVQVIENTHVSSSDGYYKRRKNQLVRTSSEDDVRQRVTLPDEGSLKLKAQKNSQDRSFSAKQSGFRQRKRSAVWMRHGSSSFRKQKNLGYVNSVSAFYIPWKKSNSWSNLKSSLNLNANEIPVFTRKLLLSKKREAIYNRSRSGFSLHRSKALSVGSRRSLKWSKSMERNSKRAKEDATLSEKRKTEQSGTGSSLSVGRNLFSRERIFRIGSERYKMDPAGRILQRISDEKASCSEVESENNSKKRFLPRRLLIGNGEYVRIGNGNQLVRDPKQRTRVLATEKVRRSLHTARLRLARKTYCQFFTRFGKCNKDGQKCPYIHDSSKVAVCTKFLSDSCYNPDCKLTHKVIPERMQDCSYFLQGLCSNESCPYRHVNVNPKSPVCEDFLKGYCADGNECRKRHTYVCPVFEASGSCEQGSKCKLHHPKTKKKAATATATATALEEKKTSKPLKNFRGRYFGVADPTAAALSEEIVSKNCTEGDVFSENGGKFTDYVSLELYNDEMNQEVTECIVDPSCVTVSQVSSSSSSSSSELLLPEANLDEMIKPIRIMNRINTLS